MRISFAVIILLFSMPTAYASKDHGGGNTVVCFADASVRERVTEEALRIATLEKKKIEEVDISLKDADFENIVSTETLDLYQARKARGLDQTAPKIIEIEDGETIEEYIERLLSRFDFATEVVREMYTSGRNFLPDNNIVWEEGGVKRRIDFSLFSKLPEQCMAVTAALQGWIGEDYMASFDRRLFNSEKQSRTSKAVLFLHEYLYAHARRVRWHENSNSVIALVGMIVTKNPPITLTEAMENIYRWKLVEHDKDSVSFSLAGSELAFAAQELAREASDLFTQYLSDNPNIKAEVFELRRAQKEALGSRRDCSDFEECLELLIRDWQNLETHSKIERRLKNRLDERLPEIIASFEDLKVRAQTQLLGFYRNEIRDDLMDTLTFARQDAESISHRLETAYIPFVIDDLGKKPERGYKYLLDDYYAVIPAFRDQGESYGPRSFWAPYYTDDLKLSDTEMDDLRVGGFIFELDLQMEI